MTTSPNWAAALVNPDRTLTRPLIEHLRRIGTPATFDTSALEARLAVVENLRFVGLGVTVVGNYESGFVITASNTTDPLACQIFGS